MKRQRFMNSRGSTPTTGLPHQNGRPPPISTAAAGPGGGYLVVPGSDAEVPPPASPLSLLLQNGYPATAAPPSPPARRAVCAPAVQQAQPGQPLGAGAAGRGPPPLMPGSGGSNASQRPGSRQQDGFDSSVGQQWSNNVQSNLAAHQQQNDPNYAKCVRKPQGYRVSQAPGGGSSLSLDWPSTDGPDRGVAAAGATAAAGGPGARQRDPSPFARHGQALVGAAPPPPARDGGFQGAAAPSPMGGGQRSYSPAPACGGPGVVVGAGGGEARTSNAYACGSNQNSGNYVCDRRTTRVSRPPGGASQISFA